MKTIYLPKLNNIRIEKYSLYKQQPTFHFNFLDGISAIIGGNGIGKTTFVEIILFCLLGHRRIFPVMGKKKTKTKAKLIDPNFFVSRMNDKFENNQEAVVYLDYNISNQNIIVGRSLYSSSIIYLRINGEEPLLFDEQYYIDTILEFSKINNFESFDKLIRTFLFFDEGRKNIAWDPEMQDEILRILFFEDEFLGKFAELEDEVISLDTKGRHKSEDRRVEKQSLEDLINEKEKLFTDLKIQIDSNENIVEYFEQKNIISKQAIESKEKLEIELEELKNYQKQYDVAIGERNELYQIIEGIESEISKLETKLYSSIYNKLPDYYLSIERTLISEGKCLACGSKHKNIKEAAIQHKKNGHCFVCDTPINVVEEYDPEIVDQINKLTSQKEELQIRINNRYGKIKELKHQNDVLSNNVNNLRNDFNKLQREIIYIDSQIAKFNVENGSDAYSQIVEAKQRKIEQLNEEIIRIYDLRDKTKVELQKLHRKFTNVVINLNEHLSKFFNKYASTFIGMNCELTVEQKTINRIPHVLYLPRIDGSIREGVNSVSESQRFFLDQAFRMAIIDYLQKTIDGFNTFFITETPEGSLDIAYERQVANMFNLFASSSNNIIFTSNLNSSNFLLNLYKSIPINEREKRTLNLLEINRYA